MHCLVCSLQSKQKFGMFRAGVVSGLAFTIMSVKMHYCEGMQINIVFMHITLGAPRPKCACRHYSVV